MRILVLLLILAVVLLYAQSATTAKKISAAEAHKMMQELKDYIILDVRTEKEFKEIRIDKAILIPDFELKQRAKKELTDKNQVILIYCRSGRRSAISAVILAELGYSNVYDFGGIINWPYETVKG